MGVVRKAIEYYRTLEIMTTTTAETNEKREQVKAVRELSRAQSIIDNIKISGNSHDAEFIRRAKLDASNRLGDTIAHFPQHLELDENNDEDRNELVQFLMECEDSEGALNTMREGDGFYLGWTNGNFIKYGDDSFASANFSGDTKQALEYLETV